MSIPTNVELKEQLDRIEKKVDALAKIYEEVYRREYGPVRIVCDPTGIYESANPDCPFPSH